MITVAALQLRPGESLTGKRTSERAAGLLSLRAKWRHGGDQKSWDDLVHAPVLEESYRFVETRNDPALCEQNDQD